MPRCVFIREMSVLCLFQDLVYDPNNIDNFMTEEDELGRLQVQQEIEEKRKM